MITEIKQKEFCRLTGLTRKSLLIYEDKKILIPYRIDIETGYRFYNLCNIFHGEKLAFLRSLHFSLYDIETILNDSKETLSILQNKKCELQHELQRISHGISFFALNNDYPLPFSDELRVTTVQLRLVATAEGRGDARDIALAHKLLSRHITNDHGIAVGDSGTYYFDDSTSSDMHFKAFVPVLATPQSITGAYKIEYFGSPRFTFLRHFGSYELLPERYGVLISEIKKQRIHLSGEYLEIYRTQRQTKSTAENTTLITDIGVPTWA